MTLRIASEKPGECFGMWCGTDRACQDCVLAKYCKNEADASDKNDGVLRIEDEQPGLRKEQE